MEKNQDTITRAYALLSALRSSVDQPSIAEYNSITGPYVTEYHKILDLLESTGINVSHFRIRDSELQPQLLVSTSRGSSYSKEKYVRKSYFLSKLDAILTYFHLQTSKPKRTIGFTPPEKHEGD